MPPVDLFSVRQAAHLPLPLRRSADPAVAPEAGARPAEQAEHASRGVRTVAAPATGIPLLARSGGGPDQRDWQRPRRAGYSRYLSIRFVDQYPTRTYAVLAVHRGGRPQGAA